MKAVLPGAIGFVLVAALLLVMQSGDTAARASSEDETAMFTGLACVDTRCDEPAIGSDVAVLANGSECASTTSGPYSDGENLSYYVLYVAVGLPGCGEAGDTLTFEINGRPAKQTAVLEPGTHGVDIYVGEDFAHYAGHLTCHSAPCYGPCTDYCGTTVNVAAWVGGSECTSYSPSGWLLAGGYADLSVTCGGPGDMVGFTVGGEWAAQAAVWEAGFHQLDLSVGSGDFPSTVARFTNDTGVAADGIAVFVYPATNFNPITENPPGCGEPSYEYTNYPYDPVTVTWPTACVDPGESVEFLFGVDCADCPTPGVDGHVWMLHGTAIPMTAEFYGYACVDTDCSEDVFDLPIVAKIGDVECGTTTTGIPYSDGYQVSRYALTVLSDADKAGCGTPGRGIEFYIDGRLAKQNTWFPGNTLLDLSVGEPFMHLDGGLSCNGQGCYDICDECHGPTIKAFVGDVECGSRQVLGYLLTGTGYGDLSVLSAESKAGCGTPGAEVRFEVDGHPARETIAWQAGFTSLTLTVPFPERLWADLDCDGHVTSRDVQATLRLVLEQPPLSKMQPCPNVGTLFDTPVAGPTGWGDWDCDGNVTSHDVQIILRTVLGGFLSIMECASPGDPVLAS